MGKLKSASTSSTPATRPEQAAGVTTNLEADERDNDRLVIYAQTDYGNCRRLADRHGHLLRYVSSWGWLVWDGTRWKRDKTDEVMRKAKETVSAIDPAPSTWQGDLAGHAKNSQAIARLQAMIKLARSEPEIVATPDEFDTDPWLLNVNNGTIDLRTGELRPHRQEDLMTQLAPVNYDPEAACSRWMKFLDRIMDGNHGLIRYLQQTAGCALTGDTSEILLLIVWGPGKNGKTVYLETFKDLLGDYAKSIPVETLVNTRRANQTETLFSVARLRDARYVIATETQKGRQLDEALIKILTGGDTVVARNMYEPLFEFRPKFKIFLCSNYRPSVSGTDEAIWERLKLIPFTVFIPKEERDKNLRERLRSEHPGILAWAVRGCLDWRKVGLQEPQEVISATESYRQDLDVIGRFIEARCIRGEDFQESSDTLYRSYCGWCGKEDETPASKKIFGMELKERGFNSDRYTKGEHKGKNFWRGLRLRGVQLWPFE